MLLSCGRTSYQMENIADFCHYCDILMPYTVNYFSSRETILSAKMYFRHNLMSSVDHSTADAMKPSISKGYHLGSVNSSLVNLYLIPPFPSLPSLPAVSPSCLSAWPYPFIKAQLTCIYHIYSTYTNDCVHIHRHTRYRFSDLSVSVALRPLK